MEYTFYFKDSADLDQYGRATEQRTIIEADTKLAAQLEFNERFPSMTIWISEVVEG